jgi:hypothetical protein
MLFIAEKSQQFLQTFGAWGQTKVCARHASAAVAFLVSLLPVHFARAQSPVLPDVVKLPPGINTGSSSFYDGFGGSDPGWTSLNYFRWDDFASANFKRLSPDLREERIGGTAVQHAVHSSVPRYLQR